MYGDQSIPSLPFLVPGETRKINDVNFYKYDSTDFKNANIYSWNYGVYIAKIDFLLNIFSMQLPTDAWNIELALKNLFDCNGFTRWGTECIIFKASNMNGINITKSGLETNLRRFFGGCFQQIKPLIGSYRKTS